MGTAMPASGASAAVALFLALAAADWHPAAAAAARALRRTPTAPARFPSLSACEAAYDHLAGQSGSGPSGWGGVGGLSHDEDSVAASPSQAERRTRYVPPGSSAGRRGARGGWDYRTHGDDWVGLGECGSSLDQSPVDLTRHVDVPGQTKYLLWFDYYLDPGLKPSQVTQLVNDGHGVRYDVSSNKVDLGFVKIGHQEYAASEYIFHAPSEHSVDGAVFPLELQIYNRAASGAIVAIAVFFREGPSHPFLAALRASLGGVGPRWTAGKGSGVGLVRGTFPAAFDLESLIPKGDAAREHSFYNYEGSLTQPPCTSGVDWWVLSTPVSATRDEIRFLRRAIFTSPSMRHGNARSAMPLGNRTVFAGLVGFQAALRSHSTPAWQELDEAKQPRGYSSGDAPWGPHWSVKG